MDRLTKFKKYTLGNKPNSYVTLKGKVILKLVDDEVKDEKKDLIKKFEKLIENKMFQAEQQEFAYIWGEGDISKAKFEKFKQDILVELREDMNKL